MTLNYETKQYESFVSTTKCFKGLDGESRVAYRREVDNRPHPDLYVEVHVLNQTIMVLMKKGED